MPMPDGRSAHVAMDGAAPHCGAYARPRCYFTGFGITG